MNIQQLIQGCQCNDRNAQQALVEAYSSMLYTVSLRYTIDKATAKDVLQESWIKILRYFKNYDPQKGNLEAWMRKIVINTALQGYQKSSYQLEKTNLADVTPPSIHPDVFAQLGAQELMLLVRQLPAGYQIVFNLYVIEGYSHAEISAMLGIKEASSRSQLNRARKQLQALIIKQENTNYHESRAV